jgi:tetratricopeptide (TPR) repeat protein
LPRQQTLRALIDWSYDLLAPTEQTLLRRLSVFSGGWSLEGAEAVCSGGEVEDWEVLDLLSRLVAKSLVVVEPPSEGQVRYHLLENLRRYARERLTETEEASELPLRHRDWFLTHAEAAEPHLSGPQQESWLNQLARDHDNLRVALTFSHDRADDAEAELRLATALWKFWWIRGHFREGRNFLRRALARSEGANLLLRAKAFNDLGILADAQGNYQNAVSYFQESLVTFRSLGDNTKVAHALNNLGNTASSQNDWKNARDYYEQGLTIYRTLEDEEGIAILLMNIGIVANHQQEYDLARSLYEESLAIFRKRNDRGQLAVVLINLGELACNLAEYEAAHLYLLESLQIAEALGEKEWIASILLTLAYTAWPQGRYEQAAKLFGAAMSILNSQGLSLSPRDQVSFTKNSDIVHTHLGEAKFQAAWRQGEGAKLSQLIRELS